MKKVYLIVLVIVNLFLLCGKIYSNKLKNINLKLKEDEIAVVILSLQDSKSLLVKAQDIYLLYTFSYENSKNLENNVALFTEKVDYVFMNEEYPLSYPYKIQLDELTVIQNIQLEPNRLHYNNYTFCINEKENCDFIYLTKEIGDIQQKSTIFYDEFLAQEYIESFHDDWIDVYKITNESYTILVLGNDFEIIHLDQ